MKVSRKEANDNRDRVIEVAARLFREKGFDGIGVADLMKGAGMTHGGFYGQFTSKEDLAAQACARAFAETQEKWSRSIAGAGDPFTTFVTLYLSSRHRDDPGNGCAFVALGAEAARHEPAVRGAFSKGLRQIIEMLAQLLPDRSKASKTEQRDKALTTMASLVGALVLARAVDDPKLSREILQCVRDSLTS